MKRKYEVTLIVDESSTLEKAYVDALNEDDAKKAALHMKSVYDGIQAIDAVMIGHASDPEETVAFFECFNISCHEEKIFVTANQLEKDNEAELVFCSECGDDYAIKDIKTDLKTLIQKPTYEEWLDALRVGDTVECTSSTYRQELTIRKITPTKQIKTNQGYTFKKGKTIKGYDVLTLGPISYETKVALEVSRKRKYLMHTNLFIFMELPAESIENIYNTLTTELEKFRMQKNKEMKL